MSLPPEILKKVKLLEIRTRKIVNNLFAGEYSSAFKGQGMTFSELREYVPGDDVRSISWPVTARTGKTYIKKFDEERELVLILAIDISGSNDFGSKNYYKGEVMAHLAALLGFSASKNKDPVGLILFSDQVEHFVPPKKGRGHIHRILRDIYYFKPRSKKTDLNCAAEYLQGVLKKRANIFLLSDFYSPQPFETSLSILSKRHEVTAIVVEDKFEQDIPRMGLVDFEDAETGKIVTVDTSSSVFRHAYKKNLQNQVKKRDKNLKSISRLDVNASEDFVKPLISFFKGRR